MKACGLIVEYNPLHNGHIYHIEQAKKTSNAECMVAIMSGTFLQRGEPAIIDKFHRARAALASGIDIVLELPYAYAVQSSKFFAKGAVQSLNEIGVSSICFGSESGSINDFISSYDTLHKDKETYNNTLKKYLSNGLSYPAASEQAYQAIGLGVEYIDLVVQPNNILGLSYVNEILANNLAIQPITLKRTKSNFHEQTITSSIASATSIRKELINVHTKLSDKTKKAIPLATINELENYKRVTTMWHDWERYFPLLHYRVLTMTLAELAEVSGVDEGLENRIKKTANTATSFRQWITAIKTKRYTWTRLQRMFVHILTNTKKADLKVIDENTSVPYIRILGLTETGRTYLNNMKKNIEVPLISKLARNPHPILAMEERAMDAYYSILSPNIKNTLRKQELLSPIIV